MRAAPSSRVCEPNRPARLEAPLRAIPRKLEFTFFFHTHTVRKSIQNNVQPLGRFLRGPAFSSEGLAASATPSRRGGAMKSTVIGLGTGSCSAAPAVSQPRRGQAPQGFFALRLRIRRGHDVRAPSHRAQQGRRRASGTSGASAPDKRSECRAGQVPFERAGARRQTGWKVARNPVLDPLRTRARPMRARFPL